MLGIKLTKQFTSAKVVTNQLKNSTKIFEGTKETKAL